jgi:hypothetical protein
MLPLFAMPAIVSAPFPLFVSSVTASVLRRQECPTKGTERQNGGRGEVYIAQLNCAIFFRKRENAQVQFAVGFKIQGKTGHVVVDAEDALIAALKVKMQRPEALIAYVRQQNKRGDTRHPMRRLSSETP